MMAILDSGFSDLGADDKDTTATGVPLTVAVGVRRRNFHCPEFSSLQITNAHGFNTFLQDKVKKIKWSDNCVSPQVQTQMASLMINWKASSKAGNLGCLRLF
jgi:hypothetical protein